MIGQTKKTAIKKVSKVESREEKFLVKEWPPKKFENKKGSGYGTTWVPPTIKRQSISDTIPTTIKRSSSARNLRNLSNLSSTSLSRSNLNLNQSMMESTTRSANQEEKEEVSALKSTVKYL